MDGDKVSKFLPQAPSTVDLGPVDDSTTTPVDCWACLPLCQTSKATKFFLGSSKRLLFHPEEFGTWRDPGTISKSHLISSTSPKTNTEPENEDLEEEVPFWNHHFQVPLFVFGRVVFLFTHEQRCP